MKKIIKILKIIIYIITFLYPLSIISVIVAYDATSPHNGIVVMGRSEHFVELLENTFITLFLLTSNYVLGNFAGVLSLANKLRDEFTNRSRTS